MAAVIASRYLQLRSLQKEKGVEFMQFHATRLSLAGGSCNPLQPRFPPPSPMHCGAALHASQDPRALARFIIGSLYPRHDHALLTLRPTPLSYPPPLSCLAMLPLAPPATPIAPQSPVPSTVADLSATLSLANSRVLSPRQRRLQTPSSLRQGHLTALLPIHLPRPAPLSSFQTYWSSSIGRKYCGMSRSAGRYASGIVACEQGWDQEEGERRCVLAGARAEGSDVAGVKGWEGGRGGKEVGKG